MSNATLQYFDDFKVEKVDKRKNPGATNATPPLSTADSKFLTRFDPAGLYKFSTLQPHLPVGKTTWYRLMKEGGAPLPAISGNKWSGGTVWRGSDVLEYLENPLAYQPPAKPPALSKATVRARKFNFSK